MVVRRVWKDERWSAAAFAELQLEVKRKPHT
jgi:hypothetical protein